jgi:hypothetical protein
MSVRRAATVVAALVAALSLLQTPLAEAAPARPMACAPDTYYDHIVNHGDVLVVVGPAQANYNGTTSNQTNRFSSEVSGTISFAATASVSVSGTIVAAAISGTLSITTTLTLVATLGNEVSFISAPHTTAHAEYGVWRLKTTGSYEKTQPNCSTLAYATTAWSPHYVGWYTWIS